MYIAIAMALMLSLSQPPRVAAQPQGQPGGSTNPLLGSTNPDGSLLPAPPLSRLFTEDTYAEYTLLNPGTQQFRVRFRAEESRIGSTEFDWIRFESQLLADTPGGEREGSDLEVYDPRTGKPLKFTYGKQNGGTGDYFIRVILPAPVPAGGIGRVLIYKTFKDARSYMMHGEDLIWVRNMLGYRLGLVLPKGFGFISSNVAAQLSTQADGRLKLAFANPSVQSNAVTIHARKTGANLTPAKYEDMFFDDIKTLYNLDVPETHAVRVEQIYSDFRKGDTAKLDSLADLQLQDFKVIDMDTAKVFTPVKVGTATVIKLDVPIVDDKQSAHIKITGLLKDAGYSVERGDLAFDRTLHGLRNSVLLPEGWEVAEVSQSGTIGMYRGRTFVAFINLNGENNYRVTIHAKKRASTP